MHTTESFKALVIEIESLGYDTETACHYAALIGDMPLMDKDGLVVVTEDDGRILARLALKFCD